jgi:hypothetical protein
MARFTINYLPFRDNTGETAGRWTLTVRGEALQPTTNALTQVAIDRVAALDIVIPTGERGRLAAEENWGQIANNGIAVMELEGTRASRHVYFIRQAAASETTGTTTTFTPASRPGRVQASSQQNAPRAITFRANRPMVRFNANMVVDFGAGTTAGTIAFAAGAAGGTAVVNRVGAAVPDLRLFTERSEVTFAAANNGRAIQIWAGQKTRKREITANYYTFYSSVVATPWRKYKNL